MERINDLDEAKIVIENLNSYIRDNEKLISHLHNIINSKNDEIIELKCKLYFLNDKLMVNEIVGSMKGGDDKCLENPEFTERLKEVKY